MPSDAVISPVSITSEFKVATKIIPTYLVHLEMEKKVNRFIATKFDEHSSNCAKFIGFYCDSPSELIISEYKELIKNTDRTKFVEILVPWNRIVNITSLVFQLKETSK